jgi:replication-associated recombination protein RarA
MGDGFGGCRYAFLVVLLGRVAELAACQAALSAGSDGAAVVITGPPGIGKTSLWRAVTGSGPTGVVLRTTGVPGVPGGRAAFANLADHNQASAATPRSRPQRTDW